MDVVKQGGGAEGGSLDPLFGTAEALELFLRGVWKRARDFGTIFAWCLVFVPTNYFCVGMVVATGPALLKFTHRHGS